MKFDIDKFSEWLEKTIRAGLADERAMREWKLSQRASPPATSSEPVKTS